MIIKPLYEDSPGMAVSEALRLYRVGKECSLAIAAGLTQRQLCVMTGLSLSALEECLQVSSRFQTDDDFLKSFQNHELGPGSAHRTWGSFLISLGINTISSKEAAQILATVKQLVQRISMVAHGTADPEIAHKTLGSLRAWIVGRIPSTVWDTIDRNFFAYQKCSYCNKDAEEPELQEINGLLITRCNQCKSEGVDYTSINWQVVAMAYAAYAFECNNAAEIYRTI